MWSIVTPPLHQDPNAIQALDRADGAALEDYLMGEDGRGRFFWDAKRARWTRSVGARTYYTTRREAEEAAVYVAAKFPALIGRVAVMSAVDIHLEVRYGKRNSIGEDGMPF